MRTLLLFRGSPGTGKSTLIKNLGLEQYTISPDEIRQLYASPREDCFGKRYIPMSYDKLVWEDVFKIAEIRMKDGEFTVIDATNSQTHEMAAWKKLATKYRHRIFLVDLTDVSIRAAKERNQWREEEKYNDVAGMVNALRNNPNIKEKELGDEKIELDWLYWDRYREIEFDLELCQS